jgi:hypothetical protein
MKRTLLALLLLAPAAAHAQTAAEGTRALARVFGAEVALAGEFRPSVLAGDLDGDGARDLVVMARLRGARNRLPAGVRVLYPWRAARGDTAVVRNQLALVVLPGRGGAYVATGRSFFDTPIWKGPQPGTVSLARRRGRPAVVIPTEAGIDTYLQWNGRTFALETPAEEP